MNGVESKHDLRTELVVNELLAKQVSFSDHVIVNLAFDVLNRSWVQFASVGLAEQTVARQLRDRNSSSDSLIDEEIGVVERESEICSLDSNAMRGHVVHCEGVVLERITD